MDEYEEKEGGPQKIARTRLKRVTDWRLMHGHWAWAYKAKALRPHDYEVINSFAVCYLTLILMGTLYGIFETNKTIAFMLVLPVYYITMCLNLASSVIY